MFDMLGNVAEWCQDRLLPYPQLGMGKVSEDREDTAPVTEADPRVLRGGSTLSRPIELRCAFRTGAAPSNRQGVAGFRLARTVRGDQLQGVAWEQNLTRATVATPKPPTLEGLDTQQDFRQVITDYLRQTGYSATAQNAMAWRLVKDRNLAYRDPKWALELAAKAVELAPAEGSNWNTLGVAHYRAGQWTEAVKALTKAAELMADKQFSSNGFFLAMAHGQLKEEEQARRWYERAVEWMDKQASTSHDLRRFRAEAEESLRPDMLVKSQPLWDCLWLANSGALAWEMEVDVTLQDFERSQRKHSQSGRHLRSVAGYRETDAVQRFGAIWIEGSSNSSALVNAPTLQPIWDRRSTDEMPICLNEFFDGVQLRRSTVLVKEKPFAAWAVRTRTTAEAFQKEWDDFVKTKGYRPVIVTIDKERQSYNALWGKDGKAYRYDASLSIEEFRALAAEKSGWRPCSVDAYYEDGIRRYVVVWVEDELDWTASIALPSRDLEGEIKRKSDDGYYPVVIHAAPPEVASSAK
jgi:hypothetical protein